MKNITETDYEIIARRRAKLADGTWGWTGICRAAYQPDITVVGKGRKWNFVPSIHRIGDAGSSQERAYARLWQPREDDEY